MSIAWVDLSLGEKILYHGLATKTAGLQKLWYGRLVLTNKRLLFRTVLASGVQSWNLRTVKDIFLFQYKPLAKAIRVEFLLGGHEDFVVSVFGRKKWIDAFRKALSEVGQDAPQKKTPRYLGSDSVYQHRESDVPDEILENLGDYNSTEMELLKKYVYALSISDMFLFAAAREVLQRALRQLGEDQNQNIADLIWDDRRKVHPIIKESIDIIRTQSIETAKEMLDKAIDESKKGGVYDVSPRFGDIILGQAESENPKFNEWAATVRADLPKKRAEGVRDEDIRWWWNLPEIARLMMIEYDSKIRFDFITTSDEDCSVPAMLRAATRLGKYHPRFGDPDDTTVATGEDRPLPGELRNRVERYVQKRMQNDPEEYFQNIENASSFNAFVRKEISQGTL